jgi:hypothetical protein
MAEQTVELTRRVRDGVDRYGNPVYKTIRVCLPGAVFAPGQAVEAPAVGEGQETDTATLYFPDRWPDVARGDRVSTVERLEGGGVRRHWEVDGAPTRYRDPWGSDGGTVVKLRRSV